MSKSKGRKRKAGARYPSGDIKREPPTTAPTTIQRVIKLAEDSALGTQLGWLRLHKSITDKHYSAGMQFAQLVGQYDRVMGMPRRSAKAPSYERGFGGASGFGGPDPDPAVVESVKRRYLNVMAKLHKGDPTGRIAGIVVRLCVEDAAPDWAEKVEMLLGLQLLVLHFQIDKEQPGRKAPGPKRDIDPEDDERAEWMARMREEQPYLSEELIARAWRMFASARQERDRFRRNKQREAV